MWVRHGSQPSGNQPLAAALLTALPMGDEAMVTSSARGDVQCREVDR